MAINVKLEAFEGPLDLLLHLIEKAEVDIYNIPIAEITDQYMEYIQDIQVLDMEVASEFLVMAATLLEIKSKMLLPKPKKEDKDNPDIDPRAELVQKLLEYKKYKDITGQLRDKLVIYEKVFYKMPEPIEDYITDFTSLTGVSVDTLVKSLRNVMLRNRPKPQNNHREIFREVFTVEDKMQMISKFLITRAVFYFEDLFDMESYFGKYEIVVTFLAILELTKRKSITVEQEKNFDKILIKRRINH